MKLYKKRNATVLDCDFQIKELFHAELELVSGGANGALQPACVCKPDRSGNLVCTNANDRVCG
jgi:hypothetical protein